MEKTLLKTENLIVAYNPNENLLIQTWKGFINSNEYRNLVDKIVSFYSIYNINYCISDTREAKAISVEDTNYAASSIAKCEAFGLKRLAVILPKSAITKMSLKRLTSSTDQTSNIETKYFDSLDMASKWFFN